MMSPAHPHCLKCNGFNHSSKKHTISSFAKLRRNELLPLSICPRCGTDTDPARRRGEYTQPTETESYNTNDAQDHHLRILNSRDGDHASQLGRNQERGTLLPSLRNHRKMKAKSAKVGKTKMRSRLIRTRGAPWVTTKTSPMISPGVRIVERIQDRFHPLHL